MKVMIVEDEEKIREGVLNLIDWGREGFDTPIPCASAIEALDYLEKESVDLIITDIFMPVLTGLEFSRLVKEKYADTAIVVLTGHERFELAREAIEIGIRGYLLKPVFPEDLIYLLRDIREELQKKIMLRDWIKIAEQKLSEYMPVVRERFWWDVVSGSLTDQDELRERACTAEIPLDKNLLLCVAVRAPGQGEGESGSPLTREMALRQIIKEIFSDTCVYSLNREGAEIAILNRLVRDDQLKLLITSIRENLKLSVCVGVGCAVKSVLSLHKSAAGAVEAARSVRSSDKVPILRYDDMVYWDYGRKEYPFSLEKRILDGLRFREKLDREAVGEFFGRVLPPENSPDDARIMLLQFWVAVYRFSHEYALPMENDFYGLEKQIENFGGVEEEFTGSLEKLAGEIRNSHEKYVAVMVDTVKAIMEREYADAGLSVAYLAERIGVTPNYLSRVFSAQTGRTCTEYLTGLRMEAAGKMLVQTDKKSYHIAMEVGYPNPNYFSALFKKYSGLSPREYRERGGRREESAERGKDAGEETGAAGGVTDEAEV